MAGGGCLGALFGVGWNGSCESPRAGARPNKPIPEDPKFTDEDEGNAHSGPGGYTGGAYSESYYGGGLDDDDDDESHW